MYRKFDFHSKINITQTNSSNLLRLKYCMVFDLTNKKVILISSKEKLEDTVHSCRVDSNDHSYNFTTQFDNYLYWRPCQSVPRKAYFIFRPCMRLLLLSCLLYFADSQLSILRNKNVFLLHACYSLGH